MNHLVAVIAIWCLYAVSIQHGSADEDCATFGVRKCIFPFTWKTKQYTACTSDDHVKPWCATELDASGVVLQGGNCDMSTCQGDNPGEGCSTEGPQKCVFPFKWEGTTHVACTEDGFPGKAWCSIGNGKNKIASNFGFCDPAKCEGRMPTEVERASAATKGPSDKLSRYLWHGK